jgi:RNA polymerase sigma-70 factor, ECF subfamily
VDTPQRTKDDQPDATAGTLGAVLYANQANTPISEKQWAELIESIAAGDQRALRGLYDRMHRIVFTLAVRITNSRETAEELTLDVFYDVWQRASQYDASNGTVIGWIMNQARSRAIDRLRFEQRKKRVNPHPNDPATPIAAEIEPHEACDLGQQSVLLREALTVLTPDEREAIETAYFSELTYAEVATRLDEPLGTIKTRVRSGLRKLRQALTGEAKEP